MTALYVIGGILLLLLILLLIPLKIRLVYSNGSSVSLEYLFFKLQLYPLPEKKPPGKLALLIRKLIKSISERIKKLRDKRGGKLKKAKDKLNKKQKNFWQDLSEERGVLGAIGFIKEIIGYFHGSLSGIIENSKGELEVRLCVAGEEPDETAKNYGYCCAALFPSVAIIASAFKRFDKRIMIDPEFVSGETKIDLDLVISITPLIALHYLIKAACKLIGSIVRENGKRASADVAI